jgi:hypothetical protein
MIFRGFPSAFILMVFLSIFFTDSVAMGLLAEPVLDNSKAKDDKERLQAAPEGIKDVIGAVDIKRDMAKIHEHEISAENIRSNVSPSESTVGVPSVSRPIFHQQENINKSVQFSVGARDFSHANSAGGIENYSYSDDVLSYKNLLDEVRTGLGEGIYSKLVWTYYDLKDLDERIYASMVVYDLSSSNLLGKLQQFIGVDEHINAMIVFKSSVGISGKPIGVGNGENQDPNKSSSSKVVLDFSQRNFARKEEVDTGYIQYILKLLTIKNIIYSLLILMGIGMVWRMFRFFVKQDLN